MGVGQPDSYLLKQFGMYVHQAFGHAPYQVGSSLTQKRGWKDVDVRLILPFDEYADYFGDPLLASHKGPKLMIWNLAWSTFGRHITRLPIDFQIQEERLANENEKGPRSALRMTTADINTRVVARTPSATALDDKLTPETDQIAPEDRS